MEKKSRRSGTDPVVALTLIFVVLKVMGLISWSWLWVLSPIWLTFLFFAAIFSVILVGGRIAKGKWYVRVCEMAEFHSDNFGFVKEIYNMKKVCLAVLPALTIVLELLPLGAVCIFATSPTERVKETFSYFSLTPFGYANFAPLITATLTVAIFLLSLFSLKKKGVLKALFVLSIITVVISLLPLMYGLNYYTLVGAFITVTLVIESILAKIQQK